MGTTQEYKKKIADKFAFLESKIMRYGDLRLRDENIAMEEVVCDLLNLLYSYHLRNMNAIDSSYPAIDLADSQRRIAVQVTSDKTRDKVRGTIQKFNAHGLDAQYDRLIIFVIGTKKEFVKEFSSSGVRFSAEKDIWDFSTLMKTVDSFQFQQLKQVYDHLEREYPTGKNSNKLGRLILGLAAAAAIVGFFRGQDASKKNEEVLTGPDATFGYEASMDWVSMDEAASILSDQSRVEVYMEEEPGYYYQGAALTVLYSNLETRDRYITRFSVCAEDIKEDLTPKLFYSAWTENGTLVYDIYNEGWGATGDLKIDYLGMELIGGEAEYLPVEVYIRDGAVTSWKYPAIVPGESRILALFSTTDFQVIRNADFEGSIMYNMFFRMHSQETGFEEILTCLLCVYPDSIDMMFCGGGNGADRSYVVWVETSEPEWKETYTVQQCLPANETVRLPIFIVPEKSCTMTVRIVFETLDGEIIEAMPLENVYFYVPYYNDPLTYIDGKLLDWNQIDGTEVIYFPFKNITDVIP